MARSVNQVKEVALTVVSRIGQGNSLALDGNAPFPLNIHIVKNLILKIPLVHNTGLLDKPVGQGGFTVVNMGDDAKIPYMSAVYHTSPAYPKAEKFTRREGSGQSALERSDKAGLAGILTPHGKRNRAEVLAPPFLYFKWQ
jgi:hypothetical protein